MLRVTKRTVDTKRQNGRSRPYRYASARSSRACGMKAKEARRVVLGVGSGKGWNGVNGYDEGGAPVVR